MNFENSYKKGRAILLFEKVCRTFAICGAAVMLLLSVITVASVLGRYFFNTPVSGDFEMVEIGCAIAVSAFLPYCQLAQGNVIVDFFTQNTHPKIKNVMDAFGCIMLTLMAMLFTWRLSLGGYDLYRYNDQTMILQVNTWFGFVIIVPSMALLAIAGLVTSWRALNGRFYGDTLTQEMDKS
ncbi:MAG: TRAP transporter small permease [Rhizobiaceae bacterium]